MPTHHILERREIRCPVCNALCKVSGKGALAQHGPRKRRCKGSEKIIASTILTPRQKRIERIGNVRRYMLENPGAAMPGPSTDSIRHGGSNVGRAGHRKLEEEDTP
jgi:hypothetical protein